MRRNGRPRAWTAEQRADVLALADEGMPQRAIAVDVFGDARYRGRVERILRDKDMPRRDVDPARDFAGEGADDGFDALDVTVARTLVARFERSLTESEEVASLADIERLLRVKRQLDAMETVARLRALSRERQ